MKLSFKFLLLKSLIMTLLSFLLVFPAQALHSKNSCHYYEEIKSQWHCGPSGYIESFAQPYCETYLEHSNDFSPPAQVILKNIRYCLQTYLKENFKGSTCQQLEDTGMASHEYCYLKHGYCDLEMKDLAKIMWVAKSEILNFQMWRMLLHVYKKCPHI